MRTRFNEGIMIPIRVQRIRDSELPMQDRTTALGHLEQVISSTEEFDRVVSETLPILLDRATNYTKQFLRETGQWNDDVAHEKFALR